MPTLFPTETPIGPLGIVIAAGQVEAIRFLDRLPGESGPPADSLAERTLAQLEAYFSDPGHPFSLPLAPRGSDFQQRVWQAMLRIPAGRVRSYGDIARDLGSGARAVGNACRRNPIPIVIPCHRVVSAAGIGGYSGATAGRKLEIKRWLLAHEGVAI